MYDYGIRGRIFLSRSWQTRARQYGSWNGSSQNALFWRWILSVVRVERCENMHSVLLLSAHRSVDRCWIVDSVSTKCLPFVIHCAVS